MQSATMQWNAVTVVSQVVALVLGAAVGSLLSVAAWRIPRGLALLPGRTDDEAPQSPFWKDSASLWVRFWQRSTGGQDGMAVHPRSMALATGVLFAVMALRFGLTWALPAYLLFAAMAVLLSVIDVQHHRLPDVVVLPFAGAALLLLALASLGDAGWAALARGLIGAVILFMVYLILALISPSSLGMGDVKLSSVIGLYLAYSSWRALLLGGSGGFVIAALVGIGLLAMRRADRRTMVPFGPPMLLSAILAVVLVAP